MRLWDCVHQGAEALEVPFVRGLPFSGPVLLLSHQGFSLRHTLVTSLVDTTLINQSLIHSFILVAELISSLLLESSNLHTHIQNQTYSQP